MTADFVAVDWGTSSFRLWLMDFDGRVSGESRGAQGMQHSQSAGFPAVLAMHLQQAGAPDDLPVLICGMAGARQGWHEAPYADLPASVFDLAQAALCVPRDQSLGRDIRILPGLAQRDASAPDVMRGEEVQLLGLAAQGIDGLVCLPGTHSKWAHLHHGAVRSFGTYMTGEMFDLLAHHSILRHAMPEADTSQPARVDPQDPAFLAALDQALAAPSGLTQALFGLRAGQLLDYTLRAQGLARLSGLLIGAEIGRQREIAPVGDLVLVGQQGLGALYASALARAGYHLRIVDAEAASQRGLLAAATEIWGKRL